MIKYICDLCGKELNGDGLVYDVNIEVKAKYNKIEISLKDLLVDHMQEIKELVEKTGKLDPDKLQDDVYKLMSFHLCYDCQQKYIKDPLGLRRNDLSRGRRLFGKN